MDKAKMGKFLTQLRNDKNLRQQDEADIFQVSPQAISKWESGESIPDITTLEKLSAFYKVGIDEIINGEAKAPNATTSTVVVAKSPSLEERGIGKPYYGAFIFCMSAILLAFVFGFISYIQLPLSDQGGIVVWVLLNYYETLFKVTGYPSVLAWLAGLLFLGSACMSIGLWLSPSHRREYWLWSFWLNLAHLFLSLMNVLVFASIHDNSYDSILQTGTIIMAAFGIAYFVLFLTLPITRKRTFCPKREKKA